MTAADHSRRGGRRVSGDAGVGDRRHRRCRCLPAAGLRPRRRLRSDHRARRRQLRRRPR
ncbi:hypothetical protein IOD13_12190 [Brevibacterium casei]|nr:hypothetical protein [Brevibacterium casei]